MKDVTIYFKYISLLFALILSQDLLAQTLTLTSSSPAANSINISANSSITLNFDEIVNSASANENNIVISGNQSGLVDGSFSGGGTASITFDPSEEFFSGEIITVTLTDGLIGIMGEVAAEISIQFTIASLPGPGIFEDQQTITGNATSPRSVFAADIDGDGDMDVLSASTSDDRIAWYENNGSQSFTQNTISTDADGASSVYAADIDGDGDMDVLSASGTDDKIAWYENNGSESFTEQSISTATNSPNAIFAIDVDSDGDMDILSASRSDNRIAWFENDGSESFTFNTISTSASDAKSVYAIDVDGDGDIDVLSASTNDDKIAWYENNGSEVFTERTISTSADAANGVFAIDVDGDGDIDVLSSSEGDNKIAWYENDGSESFTTRTISTSINGAFAVSATDIDGDGDIDVLAGAFGTSTTLLENDGTQSFTASAVGSSSLALFPADLDTDGDMDVVTATQQLSVQIEWYEQNSTPLILLSSSPAKNATNVASDSDISLTFDTDVDNSTLNNSNIVISGNQTGLISGFFTGGGTPTVTFSTFTDFKPGEIITISVTDGLRGTANEVATNESIQFTVVSQRGSGKFSALNEITMSADGANSVFAIDVDSDGDMDVLSSSSIDDKIAWYENDGNQSFTSQTITMDANNARSVYATDVDGDGDIDVLSASSFDNKIAWYENNGSEVFTPQTITTSATSAFPYSLQTLMAMEIQMF
ncbi:MAG: FG-GAP-like repeat-containing protein [Bacteroidota bacterium]